MSDQAAATIRAKATFDIASWEENPIDSSDGVKVTEAVVSKKYAGDIDATSTTRWLMAYQPGGTASFVGIERIVGAIDGREGSLVLQHVGQFADGTATAALTVVGGTGAFSDSTGTGELVADPSGKVTLDLTTR